MAAVAEAAKPPRRPPALLLGEPEVDPGRGDLPSQGADLAQHVVVEPPGFQVLEFPVAGGRGRGDGAAGRKLATAAMAVPRNAKTERRVMVGSSMVGKIGRALVDENPLAARVGRPGCWDPEHV